MDCMKEFFDKTFNELIMPEPLEIHGLGGTPLNPAQLSSMFSVINYRFENLLPTTTYTSKKPFELCKAISAGNGPDCETLAYAIVGRLWEMGVERSNGDFAETYGKQGFVGMAAGSGGAQ